MTQRITKSTPSYDPRDPHWDQIRNFDDGRFWEYGSRGLNRYDRRLTHVILSHLHRNSVTIVGRALRPDQNHSDFLSIRLLANPTKIVPLSLDKTTFITIEQDGKIKIERRKKNFAEFRSELRNISHEISPTQRIEICGGSLTLIEAAEPNDSAH